MQGKHGTHTRHAATSMVVIGLSIWWLAGSATGQFRDITPKQPPAAPPTRSDQDYAPPDPEPLPELNEPREKAPAPKRELLPDAEAQEQVSKADGASEADRADDIARQMDQELVDDTELRPLRFRGVMVGETTQDELTEKWGKPFKIAKGKSVRIYKYRPLPFRQVDVTIHEGRVASVLIHLHDLQEANHIAAELRMTKIEPVPVPDDYGNVMGLAFPERGVLLGFDLRDPESLVSKILLEPVNPEPFLLRAEYDFEHQYGQDLADIDTALQLNPQYAHAYWLRAKLLHELGRSRDALEAIETAIEHEPDSFLYGTLRARLLESLGKFAAARRQLDRLRERDDVPAEIKAEIELIEGDILAEEKAGQFNQAMRHHLRAIRLAAPLANDSRFVPRRTAKLTLIQAHLAVARDISLGSFQKQREVVPRWLNRGKALVEEYVRRDQGDRGLRLVAAAEALACAANLRNSEDPGRILEDVMEEGRNQIGLSQDKRDIHRLEWLAGVAMAEGVRMERLRGQFESAVEAANSALELLQKSAPERQSTPRQKYLVGRLYFHVGSLHAVQHKDHGQALVWYRKAEPLLAVTASPPTLADPRTHGESFVSMAVSYWETGERERAIELTELGTDLLQKAVASELLPGDALAVPYGNLASMHQSAGHEDEAKAFAELASKVTGPNQDSETR